MLEKQYEPTKFVIQIFSDLYEAYVTCETKLREDLGDDFVARVVSWTTRPENNTFPSV